ncbi:MAG: response regulator [Anaerolineales bacterium]|nr:response regulator [Anaerolineales bacterium]
MRRKTILLVDDDDETRRMLRLFCTHNQFDVIEAENGQDALEIIEAKCPDLVIIDIWMPGMDGFVAVRQIREKHDGSQLPILFFTARSDAEAEREGLALGAQAFVGKPISLAKLLKQIKLLIVNGPD